MIPWETTGTFEDTRENEETLVQWGIKTRYEIYLNIPLMNQIYNKLNTQEPGNMQFSSTLWPNILETVFFILTRLYYYSVHLTKITHRKYHLNREVVSFQGFFHEGLRKVKFE